MDEDNWNCSYSLQCFGTSYQQQATWVYQGVPSTGILRGVKLLVGGDGARLLSMNIATKPKDRHTFIAGPRVPRLDMRQSCVRRHGKMWRQCKGGGGEGIYCPGIRLSCLWRRWIPEM